MEQSSRADRRDQGIYEDMKKKVELLAPAGNYEAFEGVVNAGADAVYLGGEKFGARAYAQNFTAEEICRAIHTAHFMGRKIYLTVNTLVKDAEFEELYPYLYPLYEAGLDGVIVQDIGVLCYIREHFPGLALHASTQMTLTGPGGCAFLREQGVERVVPARELSLQEIRRIKEQTGMEVECFIHGAMCYCYSGQCLFSSILGARSGNRGRCAQPCRLPYQIMDKGAAKSGNAAYPLSLKDMCTIFYIPQLIEAGIDSFKIEGRMKKAEYSAGVTALYRKYIDLFEKSGAGNYRVEEEDLDSLRSLYIRSELQTGYYDRHNGREMITLQKPGYAGTDEALLAQIRTDYLREPDKNPVTMHITLKAGEPARLGVIGPDRAVSVCGTVTQKAQKVPLRDEDIRKQLSKTGGSCVTVSHCEIDMAGDVFLTVRDLNALRRRGVEEYEGQCIAGHGLPVSRCMKTQKTRLTESVDDTDAVVLPHEARPAVDVLVSTYEQLTETAAHSCRRIYIDSDLYLLHYERIAAYMDGHSDREYYLALPYVLRARDDGYLHQLSRKLAENSAACGINGFLIRNLEEAVYVRGLGRSLGRSYAIVPDAGLYCYNEQSVRFWANYSGEYTLPYELNGKEAGRLVRCADSIGMRTALIVYGRIPMMITANCIRKTAGQCRADGQAGVDEDMVIKDRYGVTFPVAVNCTHCYNIIYNSVPYSLHTQKKAAAKTGAGIWRYDFTVESVGECRQLLSGDAFPYEAYTTGHLKRGVE